MKMTDEEFMNRYSKFLEYIQTFGRQHKIDNSELLDYCIMTLGILFEGVTIKSRPLVKVGILEKINKIFKHYDH